MGSIMGTYPKNFLIRLLLLPVITILAILFLISFLIVSPIVINRGKDDER